MRRSTRARRPNNKVVPKYFALKGGLNLVDAPITMPPGMVLSAINYELLSRNGYRRIDGFERFDGQTSPSDASYWVLDFEYLLETSSISDGDILTGVTSGASAEVLSPPVVVNLTTNILKWSQVFQNPIWVPFNGSSVLDNQTNAPDGTLTAAKLTFDGTSNGLLYQSANPLTIGDFYTYSIYVKSFGGDVNPQRLVVATTIVDFTPTADWQRISATFQAYATFHPATVTNFPAIASDLYIWGAQVETGLEATNYALSLASPGDNKSGYLVLTNITGDFQDNEELAFIGGADEFNYEYSSEFA